VGRNFFWVKDIAQKSKEKEGGKKKKTRLGKGEQPEKARENETNLELVEKLIV